MSKEQISEPYVFGLTGGMGSGKSTVSTEFAARGAVILDADQIVHDLQQPEQPVLLGMVAVLGEEILLESGELDRATAGRHMFADPDKRQAIQRLIHPLVWGAIDTGIEEAKADDIVIVDAPLLLEARPDNLQTKGTIVVDTEVNLAVARLMRYRGFREEDARKRISQQMSREERLSHADYIIHNNGSLEELLQSISGAWQWINTFRQLP
jgi:dephospho-CoA kinase